MNKFFYFLCIILTSCETHNSANNKDYLLSPNEKIYVISLERTPKRFDFVQKQLSASDIKCERFNAIDGYKLEFLDLKTKKFLTTDQKKNFSSYTWKIKPVSYEILINNKSLMTFHINSYLMSLGELGCACSHREIWKEVSAGKCDCAIVFEDDVILEKDFKNNLKAFIKDLPEDWDIAFLGVGHRNQPSFLISPTKNLYGISVNVGKIFRDIDEVSGHPLVAKIQPTNLVYGMYGYIINTKGAKKLLALTNESKYPIDDIVFQQGGINTGAIKGYVSIFKLLEPKLTDSEIKKMGRSY